MTVELMKPAAPASEFPVAWERPEDGELFWEQDGLHFPQPLTPLDNAFIEMLYHQGLNVAAAAYELPISAHARRVNTYHYLAITPLPLPPEELEAMGRRAEQKAQAAMATLGERWEREWLPEIQRHLAAWRSFDLAGADTAGLLAHLDETIDRFQRCWQIHFLAAVPFLLAPSLFGELYGDLFGKDDALEAYRLLQGFDNKSLETDRGILALSRRVLAQPALLATFAQVPDGEIVGALEGSAAGRAFVAELGAFLDEFGRRTTRNGIISTPSWLEDPTPVITNIKDYLTQPDRDPLAEMASLAEERERLVAEARAKLASYPAAVRAQFDDLLPMAQVASVLSETHTFWIDYAANHEVRQVLLEFGRRLAAAGALDRPDDVFLLTLGELRESAENPVLDRRARVAARQAELDRFASVVPPRALGIPPAEGPGDPIGRAMMRFFGGPPKPSASPDELRGNPGSAGVVRGPARVIRTLEEAHRLGRGEILVTISTQPAWTPLFTTAAAVVTDNGGVLSHCAVVAREYRIPAVVGTGLATATIRDGQEIEVDGAAGVVRLR